MSDKEYDYNQDLVIKIAMDFKEVFAKQFELAGLVKDDKFNMADFAYLMMHMGRAYDVFDRTMETWFDNQVKVYIDEETDGLTPQ